jgi:hypothetical protein
MVDSFRGAFSSKRANANTTIQAHKATVNQPETSQKKTPSLEFPGTEFSNI